MSNDGVKSVFVSGPLTDGDTIKDEYATLQGVISQMEYNVIDAMILGTHLIDMGLIVYIPHLSYYMHKEFPQDYDKWMEMSLYWLGKCDALYRIGPSKGADIENEYALRHDIPIFHSMDEVRAWVVAG